MTEKAHCLIEPQSIYSFIIIENFVLFNFSISKFLNSGTKIFWTKQEVFVRLDFIDATIFESSLIDSAKGIMVSINEIGKFFSAIIRAHYLRSPLLALILMGVWTDSLTSLFNFIDNIKAICLAVLAWLSNSDQPHTNVWSHTLQKPIATPLGEFLFHLLCHTLNSAIFPHELRYLWP